MQRLWNTIALALRNLTLHKPRVLLTVLGLIFGVSSVIAMLASAEGAAANRRPGRDERGSEVSEKLFPFGDPVGKSIRIGENHFYRIIGLTDRKAPSGGPAPAWRRGTSTGTSTFL